MVYLMFFKPVLRYQLDVGKEHVITSGLEVRIPTFLGMTLLKCSAARNTGSTKEHTMTVPTVTHMHIGIVALLFACRKIQGKT